MWLDIPKNCTCIEVVNRFLYPLQTKSKVGISAQMIEKRVVCLDESGASGGPDASQGRARGGEFVGDADAVFLQSSV